MILILPGRNKNLARRFYANFFDYFIVVGLTAVYIFLGGEDNGGGGYKVTGFKALLIPFFWWLYFPCCEAAFGQTVGKRAFNLLVVNLSGKIPTIVQTTIRRIFDPIEFLTFGVGAMLLINYSRDSQRLGDMAADTTVIRLQTSCRACGTELDLTRAEALLGSFTCPNCNHNQQ